VVIGALALKGLPEVLRGVDEYRIVTFAALLVLMMIVRPEGIVPSTRRRRELHGDAEPVAAVETPSALEQFSSTDLTAERSEGGRL
ncbi:MAG: hypothetical protein R6W76_09775, partial [Caldilinea sp.]